MPASETAPAAVADPAVAGPAAVGAGAARESAAEPGDLVLDVAGLVRHYPGVRHGLAGRGNPVKAVDGVDLQLRRGETLGLVGESGCGKSTLARLLMALDRPTAGTVRVEGQDLFALSARELRAARRNIQIVLQDPYTSLDPRMTVGAIVGEPFDIHRDAVPRAGRRAAVRDLLDTVGLDPDHVDRYPHQFSGGQRQRIGIARALALRPRVLVCDEPVSALDVSVQAQVLNLLTTLQAQLGLSYVFIAHDLSVVRHVSDRVAVMYLGRIVEQGDEEQIYEHPTHPYTQALLSAVAEPDRALDPAAGAASTRGLATRRDRIILTGEVPDPSNPPSGCRFRTRCWKARNVCATEVPLLVDRPDDAAGHLSACHFADTGPG